MPLISSNPYSAEVKVIPPLSNNYSSFSNYTGLMTGIAGVGAAYPVFTLRTTSSLPVAVHRLRISFMTTTAFAAAQSIVFGAYFARGFTVNDSGGTTLTLASTDNVLKTGINGLNLVTGRTATTNSFTAGTRTLDANPLGIASGWSGSAGNTIAPIDLIDFGHGKFPVVLAANEGIVICNLNAAWGASGVGVLTWQVELQQ